jgi:glycine oxidase
VRAVRVIGGGLMGLGLARALAKAGHHVALFEKNMTVGDEASRASAGMIGPQSEAMEDDAYFAATLASRDEWPAYAKALQEESGVDFGFRDKGAIHLAFGAAYERRLEAKYLWQKKRAGALERLEGEALRGRFPYLAPRVSSAFLAYGDYWLDSERLVDALLASCVKLGVEIRCGEELPFEPKDGALALPTVLAAGAWSSKIFPQLPGIHPVKGQMLSFRVPPALLPELPIHAESCYLVPRGADRLLVGATVETVGFDKRLTGEGVEWLLQNAFETIPDLRNCEIDRLWAGLRPGSGDGWPTLGACPVKNLYLACGHYRRGILFLPLTVRAVMHSIEQGGLPEDTKAFGFERHLKAGQGV